MRLTLDFRLQTCGCGLDDEVRRADRFGFELPRAVAQFRQRHTIHDRYDGVTRFLHHTANRTTRFVRARALLVKSFTDATHRRQWAFDVPDDFAERHALRSSPQPIAAGHTAFAFHDAGGFEVVENLFEESFGDVLPLRNFLNAHH